MSDNTKHSAKMRSFWLRLPTMYGHDWIEMGEVSYGKFYSYGGLTMLRNFLVIVEKDSKLLKKVEIKDDDNILYNPEEFLDFLTNLEVVDNG